MLLTVDGKIYIQKSIKKSIYEGKLALLNLPTACCNATISEKTDHGIE